MGNRTNLVEYALQIAEACADRSEDPRRKVGAVAVSPTGRIIGTGYNGLAPGKQVPDSFWEDKETKNHYVLHAEQNLAAQIRLGEAEFVACTLQPCPSCLKLLIAQGVKRIYFRQVHSSYNESAQIALFYNVGLIWKPSKDKAETSKLKEFTVPN